MAVWDQKIYAGQIFEALQFALFVAQTLQDVQRILP